MPREESCHARRCVRVPGENHAVLGNPNQTGWKANKDEIYIDFDQKDGSGEKVIAKLNENEEIVFPTGEVWKRRRGESFFP